MNKAFCSEGVPFEGDKIILNYIDNNKSLLENRPQCYHHGDYHMGNMILVCGNDGVIENKVETFGMLYYADIFKFEKLPGFEMEKIELFDSLPENWTYPEIQPKLIEKVNNFIGDEMKFD